MMERGRQAASSPGSETPSRSTYAHRPPHSPVIRARCMQLESMAISSFSEQQPDITTLRPTRHLAIPQQYSTRRACGQVVQVVVADLDLVPRGSRTARGSKARVPVLLSPFPQKGQQAKN